jgi:hypothetical protein
MAIASLCYAREDNLNLPRAKHCWNNVAKLAACLECSEVVTVNWMRPGSHRGATAIEPVSARSLLQLDREESWNTMCSEGRM